MNSVRRLNNNIKYINFWGDNTYMKPLHSTYPVQVSGWYRHDEITEALKGMEKKHQMWKKEV